jgi:hypothetical protein
MNNREFLEQYPLEVSVHKKDLDGIISLLTTADESNVIRYTAKKISEDIWNFSIHIPTTNFAYGYFYIGILWERLKRKQ